MGPVPEMVRVAPSRDQVTLVPQEPLAVTALAASSVTVPRSSTISVGAVVSSGSAGAASVGATVASGSAGASVSSGSVGAEVASGSVGASVAAGSVAATVS